MMMKMESLSIPAYQNLLETISVLKEKIEWNIIVHIKKLYIAKRYTCSEINEYINNNKSSTPNNKNENH